MARALNNSEENIDVFTVMYSPLRDGPSEEGDVELDVRFSAHGSPYYAAERINAAVIKNLDTVKNTLVYFLSECGKGARKNSRLHDSSEKYAVTVFNLHFSNTKGNY